MKKLFIIANWKSNKTESEAKNWLREFITSNPPAGGQISDKEIIICPPFTLLSNLKSYIKENNLPIKLGAQDISPFEEGSFTGEINGKQIKEFADYVIIGHSERRKNLFENEDVLVKKVTMVNKYDLIPIFCVQNDKTFIPENVDIIAYEPIFAIGTGNPDTPENAEVIAKKIKEKKDNSCVLYGGSVNSENINFFTKMPNINGVLVGKSSLIPGEFLNIINNA